MIGVISTSLSILLLMSFETNLRALTGSAGGSVQSHEARQNSSLIEGSKSSEKQKERSKLFSQYSIGQDLRDLARTETGDIEIRMPPPLGGGDPHSPEPNLNELFKNITCDSDAIVIGVVKGESSQFTVAGDFIFTDYETAVERILKDNNANPILTNDSITITRPGGTVLFSGKKVRVVDSIFKPLNVNERYVLFLRYIPSIGAYVEIPNGGSFQLTGGKLLKHTEGSFAKLNEKYDAVSFINKVQFITGHLCTEEKR